LSKAVFFKSILRPEVALGVKWTRHQMAQRITPPATKATSHYGGGISRRSTFGLSCIDAGKKIKGRERHILARSESKSIASVVESEAHRFAAAFLMPAVEIKPYLATPN